MDEKTIMKKILAGQTDAYRELVERYQTGLIIHCENIVKNRQDGEDIAQDAFIKAYKQLANFSSDKARFSTWLYRIATNLAIDHLRKNKHKVNVKDIEDLMDSHEPVYLELDEKEHIRKVITTLEPPKYGDILKAYFWEGKSYQDIAVTYHTSTNTIGTWMSRAKLQLKEKLL